MAVATKTAGIFDYVVNQAAFIDKIVVGVKGVRRRYVHRQMRRRSNLAIGGAGCLYARVERGIDPVAGNGVQLKYGLMRKFKKLSPFVLTLWADCRPVTCASVATVLNNLMRLGHRSTVSLVELTFDMYHIPIWKLDRQLCTRARAITVISDRNGNVATLYIGSPKSPWQLRIYQKTWSILRVEFVLRSMFLKDLKIHTPSDLLLLRSADLWSRAGFYEIDQHEGAALPLRVRKSWQRLGLGLPPPAPASIIERELRHSGINPRRWVVSSVNEQILRKMQACLIW